MVLLAASIVTRSGRPVVSRQFVDMTRARIEGLLTAFPKLIPKDGGQHTFVETESVRYVYQPIEKLYMVLITTKNSNILEDLETLRLFSRVIPEYCRTQDESDIADHAFELIFAFDEVVALGYRESVNLAQIRSFTEMDSHEEKVAIAVRESQEKEAKAEMLKKAKELQAQRREQNKGRGSGMNLPFNAFGGNSFQPGGSNISDTPVATPIVQPSSKPPRSGGKAMRLGSKNKNVDHFVDQLAAEGQHVAKKSIMSNKSASKAASDAIKTKVADVNQENVHIRLEEKITAILERDGAVSKFGVNGFVQLHINDENTTKIKIQMLNSDSRGVQLQTHPNIDKKKWQESAVIGLKNPDKGFPVGQDVGVLKWRLTNTDEDYLPLTINCWPNETGSGQCDVNIEYELQAEDLELQDVSIEIPCPSGCGAPVVGDCDGSYNYDAKKNLLNWTLPVVDKSNSTGQLDFSMTSNPDDFFPIAVHFHSTKRLYTPISVVNVSTADGASSAKYSTEVALLVDKYIIGSLD